MLKDVIISLFGAYVPQTYTYTIDDVTNTIIPSGASGIDFAWLGGFVLFALTFYCIMRIVGGILNGK